MVAMPKAPEVRNKSSRYLLPLPTEELVLPVERFEYRPAGLKAVTSLPARELILRTQVEPLAPDGSQGVQRDLKTQRSAHYYDHLLQLVLDGIFELERSDMELYTKEDEGLLNQQARTLTLHPDTVLYVADGQHGDDALKRLFALANSTTDEVLRLRVNNALDEPIGVKIALGWDEPAVRRLFYYHNGLQQPVTSSISAFFGTEAGIGSDDELLAGRAVNLLQEQGFPVTTKGSGSKGMWAFKPLRDLLKKYIAGRTPNDVAQTFLTFWTRLDQAFPNQTELHSSAYREAFLRQKALLDTDAKVSQLRTAINGELSVLRPEGTSGTGAAATAIAKKIDLLFQEA